MSSTKARNARLLGKGAVVLALAAATGSWPGAVSAAESASPAAAAAAAAAAGPSLVRVYFADKREAGRLFVGFEGAIADTNYADGYHRMRLTPAQVTELRAAGYRVEAAPAEAAPALPSLPRQTSAAPAAAGAVAVSGIPYQTPTYSCYRTVDEVFAAAQRMVAEHPTLASFIDIGDSWIKAHGGSATDPTLTGDDMMTLVLSSPVASGPKPRLFITSSIHGDEIATLELAARFAEYLVGRYGTDADATWILDNNEIHLLLATNPDARRLNEVRGTSYRKNRNDTELNEICTMGGYIGVDLNRNYRFKWDECDPQLTCGYDTNACGYTYIGSAAGSEPETQAVMNRLGQLFTSGGRTGMFIDLHSYSELVLWPWGYTDQAPADVQALRTLGRKLASFNNYYPEASYQLYGTPGSSVDYAYGVFGLPAFTIEVGKAKWQDCAYFETDILPKNLNALLYAAKVARAPYETPAGPGMTSVALGTRVVLDTAPVTLSATADDRQLGVFGIETAQTIAAAQYSIDKAPWGAGASPVAMAAVDGRFGCRADDACGTQAALAESLAKELVDATFADRLADDPCKFPGQPPVGASDPAWYVQKCQAFSQALEQLQEPVTATVPTQGLTVGRHMLYLRGRDSAGNWGPVTATYLTKTTRGDVNANGQTDIVDALLIAQASVQMDPPGFIVEAADVNCDGAVTIVDALLVAQYSVNAIPVLPVCPAS